ncbi:M20/M25/M40 family metallo-hydrolase [Euzebya sp.]|uniref:M20/M25/M40 family metallo-hydrolase n=1 Tax=Euzebya sp. TaxID=1971409 RepID=UPI003515A55F
MTATSVLADVEALLLALLAVDTAVPDGETEVAPGDPRMIRAVDEVLMPLVDELAPDEVRRHADGEVAARFGPAGDDGLLVQTYVVSQHGNLMRDAHRPRIVDGAPLGLFGPTAVGQGANQNKGPMAAALRALATRPAGLARPVWLTFSLEGRSSHGGSRRLLDDLEVRAAAGVVCIGTDLAVSVANRGRADVVVEVAGASAHSSQPWLGRNPLEGVADVITALRTLPLPAAHPDLGGVTATPFRVEAWPVAPHTLPAGARVVVDRRLLPGEDPSAAVTQVRDHLAHRLGDRAGDVAVSAGEVMLPAQVDPASPLVVALLDGLRAAGVAEPRTITSKNTFDAGWACHRGIPTAMFGPGRRHFDAGVTATEAVALQDCEDAATALRHAMEALCC